MNPNIELLFTLNSILGTSQALDSVVLFFAKYYIYVIALVAAVTWYRDIKKESIVEFLKNTQALVAAVFGAEALTLLIRFFFESPRPLWVYDIPYLFEKTSNSFPSGHTMFAFSLATAIYFFGNKKIAYMLYASGLFIGVARIIAGVHYPLDILGGIVLGTVTGYLAHYFLGPRDKSST
ncbi:MAG: hypothetical protein AMXMBFR44_5420 [Candidatus Campbellbacteria bacterium]